MKPRYFVYIGKSSVSYFKTRDCGKHYYVFYKDGANTLSKPASMYNSISYLEEWVSEGIIREVPIEELVLIIGAL